MASAREAIEQTGVAFGDAYNSGDAAGLAALYTDDAVIYPPGAESLVGKTAVEAFWKAAMDSGLDELKLTTVEVEEAGDAASEVGVFQATVPGDSGGRVPVTGKLIVLWQRGADGTWRLHRDIWNMDA